MKLPTFYFGSSLLCTYCGDPAKGVDHVLAVSYQTDRKRKGSRVGYGPMTYACNSCNSILSNRFFDHFSQRAMFVYEKIFSLVKPVTWTETEIKSLDISLRDFVRRAQHKRKWMHYRVSWFQSRDYYLNIENLLWQPSIDRSSPSYNEEAYSYFSNTVPWLKALTSSS